MYKNFTDHLFVSPIYLSEDVGQFKINRTYADIKGISLPGSVGRGGHATPRGIEVYNSYEQKKNKIRNPLGAKNHVQVGPILKDDISHNKDYQMGMMQAKFRSPDYEFRKYNGEKLLVRKT